MGGRRIRAGRTRTTAYAVVLSCLAGTLGGCSLAGDGGPSGDPVAAAAVHYLERWSAGDTVGAAAATDDATAAKASLDEVADRLRVTAIEATPGEWCLTFVAPTVLRIDGHGISRPSAKMYRAAALWKAIAQAKEPITSSVL